MDKLIDIEIKNFPVKVQISKSRRAKYYASMGKVPKKYKDPERYVMKPKPVIIKGKRSKKDYLYDLVKKDFVVANPRVAGKPKYMSINTQNLYSGFSNPIQRGAYMAKIKAGLVNSFPAMRDDLGKSLLTCFFINDKFGEGNWDMDNRTWLYIKTIHDILKDKGLVEEDTAEFIRGSLTWFDGLKEDKDDSERLLRFVAFDAKGVTASKFVNMFMSYEL